MQFLGWFTAGAPSDLDQEVPAESGYLNVVPDLHVGSHLLEVFRVTDLGVEKVFTNSTRSGDEITKPGVFRVTRFSEILYEFCLIR